jgi:hypothetical protein
MGIGLGAASYMAYGLQSAFGTVQTSLITAAFIRTGSLFSVRNANQPRTTTAAIMPKASQLWQTLALVDFDVTMEYVFNDTALLPLFTAAFGRRVKTGGGAPFNYCYTLWNPPVDGGTDAAGTVYNHGLTVREIVSDGVNAMSPRVVQDICINTFVMTMNANEQLRFQLTGTGQKHLTSSAPSFTDITGTTASYIHANSTANSGLKIGTANPPTTDALVKSVVFTLANNNRYDSFLGAATGLDLKLPTRAGWPSAQFAVTMDFEDTAGFDAVQAFTDFLAATKENFRIEYYVDANNSLELLATSSTGINVIDDLKPVYNGEGAVALSFKLNCFPNNVGQATAANDELRINQTTAA